MKKLMMIFLVITGLNGCSNNSNHRIIGTWTSIDPFNGIKEITFTKETMTIRKYKTGGNPDFETARRYKIIDEIIFMEEYNRNDIFYDSPFFSYSIKGNKLILAGDYIEIYTKKEKKDIKKIKNNFDGKWELITDNKSIDFIFSENILNIIEYNDSGAVIQKNTTTFELNACYLIVADIGAILRSIEIYNNSVIYHISKDTLSLFQAPVGEIESKILYLTKK